MNEIKPELDHQDQKTAAAVDANCSDQRYQKQLTGLGEPQRQRLQYQLLLGYRTVHGGQRFPSSGLTENQTEEMVHRMSAVTDELLCYDPPQKH